MAGAALSILRGGAGARNGHGVWLSGPAATRVWSLIGEHILKVFQHWGSRSPCLLPFGAMRLLADDHNTILLHVRGWLAEGVLSHRISPISSLLRGGAVLRTIDDATDDRPIEFAKARISRLLQEANSNFGTAQAQSDTGRKSQCIPKILASVVG